MRSRICSIKSWISRSGREIKKGFLVVERECSSLILTRFFEIKNSRQCLAWIVLNSISSLLWIMQWFCFVRGYIKMVFLTVMQHILMAMPTGRGYVVKKRLYCQMGRGYKVTQLISQQSRYRAARAAKNPTNEYPNIFVWKNDMNMIWTNIRSGKYSTTFEYPNIRHTAMHPIWGKSECGLVQTGLVQMGWVQIPK